MPYFVGDVPKLRLCITRKTVDASDRIRIYSKRTTGGGVDEWVNDISIGRNTRYITCLRVPEHGVLGYTTEISPGKVEPLATFEGGAWRHDTWKFAAGIVVGIVVSVLVQFLITWLIR
jgi:hypothetical protein